jgi:ATP-binding cassette subfamily B protein
MRAIRRALGDLGRYRLDTAGALCSLLLVSAASLAAPQLVQRAVDAGLARGRLEEVWAAVAGLVGLALVRGVFNFLQGFLAERASQGVAFDLRQALFARIQRLSFSYYDRAQTGQLLTRLTSDVEQVRIFAGTGAVQFVASALMLMGCLVLLVVVNSTLAIAALAALAPISAVLAWFVRKMGPLFGAAQAQVGRLNSLLQETLRGARVVRAFDAGEREVARYDALNQALLDKNVQIIYAVANNFPFIVLFANLGTLAVVGVGGFQILHQKLTVGGLIAFNSYLSFLLLPVMTLGFLGAMLSRAGASAARIFELLDTPVEVGDRLGATPLAPLHGRLEFRDVRFRYAGAEKEVLRGVSFVAQPGELVAILGTTGSGKSTVVNLIPRFYEATAGAVLVDDRDVREVTLASLRSQVGVVLQDALLFAGTIRDNIAYGRPDATQDEVEAAARVAEAAEFIEQLPQGYATQVGERGVGLSGGQRQRVAIARALLIHPRLLILDDSTSAVDTRTEASIRAALDRLMRDRRCTAVVIAQRLSTLQDADRIIVLDQGQVVAQGRHTELLVQSPLYCELLGSQLATDTVEAAA